MNARPGIFPVLSPSAARRGGSRQWQEMLLDRSRSIAAPAPGIYPVPREARITWLSRNGAEAMPPTCLLSNMTDEGAKSLKSNPKRLQEVNKEDSKVRGQVTAQYAVARPV